MVDVTQRVTIESGLDLHSTDALSPETFSHLLSAGSPSPGSEDADLSLTTQSISNIQIKDDGDDQISDEAPLPIPKSSPIVTPSPLSRAVILAHPMAKQYFKEHPKRSQTNFGSYLLLQTLGEGEFGKVKLGLNTENGMPAAVKLIRRGTIAESARAEKVKREIDVLRIIRHPNIVRHLNTIQTDKYIGIVLEYAEGGELFDYILAHKYLREDKAAKLFAQVLSGVDYLHENHIVHRDLKLENLLMDADRNIVITDFGFANQFENRHTDLMKTSCGSPCYAAPELVVSENQYIGTAADVWSCGVILYAMLSGYLPWDDDPRNPDGDNINLLYGYITSTPLVFPDHISASAKELLLTMLQPEPELRSTLDQVKKHPWLHEHRGLFALTVAELEDLATTQYEERKHLFASEQRAREAEFLRASEERATPEPAHIVRSATTDIASLSVQAPKTEPLASTATMSDLPQLLAETSQSRDPRRRSFTPEVLLETKEQTSPIAATKPRPTSTLITPVVSTPEIETTTKANKRSSINAKFASVVAKLLAGPDIVGPRQDVAATSPDLGEIEELEHVPTPTVLVQPTVKRSQSRRQKAMSLVLEPLQITRTNEMTLEEREARSKPVKEKSKLSFMGKFFRRKTSGRKDSPLTTPVPLVSEKTAAITPLPAVSPFVPSLEPALGDESPTLVRPVTEVSALSSQPETSIMGSSILANISNEKGLAAASAPNVRELLVQELAEAERNAASFSDAGIHEHSGPLNSNALTYVNPGIMMAKLHLICFDMGMDVIKEGDFKLRCHRPKRAKRSGLAGLGLSAVFLPTGLNASPNVSMPTTPTSQTPVSLATPLEEKSDTLNAPKTMYGIQRKLTKLTRQLSTRSPSSVTETAPSPGGNSTVLKGVSSETPFLSPSMDVVRASEDDRRPVFYGDPVLTSDSGDEVNLNIELTKVKNLKGLYSISIKKISNSRLYSNLGSYKFLFEHILQLVSE